MVLGLGCLAGWGVLIMLTTDIGLDINPGVTLRPGPVEGVATAHVSDAERRFDLTWDRYMRLYHTAAAVRARVPGGIKILDVGGFDGALALFLCEYAVDVIDPITTGGSGLEITAGEYEAVVSVDALEHVAPDRRADFLAELSRVARRHLAR